MKTFSFKKNDNEIDPDEIFLDSVNLPRFDTQQFEGRIEKPISKTAIFVLGVAFLGVFGVHVWKIGILQIKRGEAFSIRSSANSLKQVPVFPERGALRDRNGVVLASSTPVRAYIPKEGFAHILGYVGYPSDEDLKSEQARFTEEYIGKAGAEKVFNDELRGVSGLKLAEVDAKGNIESENVYRPPVPGNDVSLSIDERVQRKMYEYIKAVAADRGFSGGAGVMLDLHTGEVIAMTSYPEYDPQVISDGEDHARINQYLNDTKQKPFLNRALSGVYTPGSTVKPIIAVGALTEKVITPEKQILSTGSISIQNPYDKTKKTVFKDWKAHGWVDMREALAVSSDVYFYEVGGGFEGQKGIGIANIDKYAHMFGLGEKTGIELEGEATGVIPTPEWKAANFDGEAWYVGNTYHTSIGQYGFGVTPLQLARVAASLATGNKPLTPTVLKKSPDAPMVEDKMGIDPKVLKVVQEGMRRGVADMNVGTVRAINFPGVTVAAKTGTAELGITKQRVNSWIQGYFPYENPRYAFALVMERGEIQNQTGAVYVMRQLLEWMSLYTSEYLRG